LVKFAKLLWWEYKIKIKKMQRSSVGSVLTWKRAPLQFQGSEVQTLVRAWRFLNASSGQVQSTC
jgi:hypothetical protein